MRILFFLTILFSIQVQAAETWQCTEDAATRSDNVWYACGIGESSMEGQARQQALESAIREFNTVCDMSTDCFKQKRTVEPKRTTCSEKQGFWKCYRMIQVTLPFADRTSDTRP